MTTNRETYYNLLLRRKYDVAKKAASFNRENSLLVQAIEKIRAEAGLPKEKEREMIESCGYLFICNDSDPLKWQPLKITKENK